MSAGFAEAFAAPEGKYRAQVLKATFGHLEQKRGDVQPGWFVFSISDYGGQHVILGSDWGSLPDSPGLYWAMMDYVEEHGVRGQVTRLVGTVTRLQNGKYRISGKRQVVKMNPPKAAKAMKAKVASSTHTPKGVACK